MNDLLFKTNFPLLKSIPKKFREKWAELNVDIIQSIEDSEPGSPEHISSCKWFLAKHRIFLRKGITETGRFDQHALDRRFEWWAAQDYQSLIQDFEKALRLQRRPSKPIDNSHNAKAIKAHEAAADGSRKKAARFL